MGVQLSETAQKELQKLLDAYPRDGHPGTAVGVVNKHGEILFLSSTGVRDVSTDKPMENDTVSMTVTTIAESTGLPDILLYQGCLWHCMHAGCRTRNHFTR